jgi:predicted acyl esterase
MSPGSDVLRASYRDPLQRVLLQPGKIYQLNLPNMRMGNVFKAGHRVRVQISASFFPDFSRNLQTGALEYGPTSERNTAAFANSGELTRVAKIRIYHDPDHPSRIVFPVIPR